MKNNNLIKIIPEFNRNFCQTKNTIGTLIFFLNTWFYFSHFRRSLSFSTIDSFFELTKHLALIYGHEIWPEILKIPARKST